MAQKNTHINYIEFKAQDLQTIKQFYSSVFGWVFTDYGPTYTSFADSGIAGGFELTEEPIVNGVLVVLYHENLEEIQQQVEAAGAKVVVPIFSFPGGRRFEFLDPSGNQLAIWSE